MAGIRTECPGCGNLFDKLPKVCPRCGNERETRPLRCDSPYRLELWVG
jgi:predicted amidophosphoribosyltransferase